MVRALLLSFILLPTAVYALDSVETELVPMGLKVMAGLILVLGLVLLLYALLKKSGRWIATGQNREINLIEVRYLAPKKALYLVEVNGSKLLLSGTSERMETLAQWPLVKKNSSNFEHVLSEECVPQSQPDHSGVE
jgi:flagellar protein FliO/FliZ